MSMSSCSGGCKQHNRRGGAQCICQAKAIANKKAEIRDRAAALADRKASLAASTLAADAEDEEPRCFGHSLQTVAAVLSVFIVTVGYVFMRSDLVWQR